MGVVTKVTPEVFERIKLLQEAGVTQAQTARMLKLSTNSMSMLYRSTSLEEYKEDCRLKNLKQRAAQSADREDKRPQDDLTTLLNNINDSLISIDKRLENLEAAHETKFSFFKR